MNIKDTSKDLISLVASIIEKKNVKEVDEPSSGGEKDFKDFHLKDLETYTEKLDPKADAGVWIDDFQKSDAPQFKDKSKEERKQMALAAYYSARKKAGLEEQTLTELLANQTFKSNDVSLALVASGITPSNAAKIIKKIKGNKFGNTDIRFKDIDSAISDIVGKDKSTKIAASVLKHLEKLAEGADKDTKGDKEAYQKFFNATLKKYGVSSPAELSGEDEKKFYDEIDAGWKGDNEKKESVSDENIFEGMKMVNKKTGKDVTGLVIDLLSGKITKQEFEKLAGIDPKDRVAKKEEVVKEAYKVVKLGGTSGTGGEFFMGDKGIQKMVELSKKNPNVIYTVSSDNYGEFKQHWLRNGKFAKKTVANVDYDMSKNAVRGVPKGKTVKDTIFSLTQVVKEESLKEAATNAFYRTTRIHLALRNAGLKPNDAKKVTDGLKIIYGGGSEYKGSEVENVVRAVIGDSLGRKLAAKTIEQLHDLSRSVTQKWGFNESIEEMKSATGYEIYHKDFSSAMQHAYDFAKKKLKVEVDPEEIMTNVAMGPKRPSTGKTNSYRLKGKGGAIQVQVYNTGSSYELNMYKEEVATNDELTISEAAETLNESTEIYVGKGYKILRYAAGAGKTSIAITKDGSRSDYVDVSLDEFEMLVDVFKKLGNKASNVLKNAKDMKTQLPIKEAVRSMDKDAKLKIFNDLKKGDKVQIKYDSPIRKGEDYHNFTVTRNKSVVGKARVEKIILAKDGNPGGVKFFLYNRNGMVSFAIGDMGAVIVDMKKG